ncbi:hypothetical protein H4219_004539 [Mycoemilia scoparia]|uniref:G-patch domain-containing protein n=1 Tax=Mycoemilia scoparia TaxID=417184 RepID=A0A9W8DRP9_9FUNG|nr:hypothetical protein H4219_004539 [Mycoemilia scoparia]
MGRRRGLILEGDSESGSESDNNHEHGLGYHHNDSSDDDDSEQAHYGLGRKQSNREVVFKSSSSLAAAAPSSIAESGTRESTPSSKPTFSKKKKDTTNAPTPDKDFAKFAKEGKGVIWKMMQKMGYKAGSGLGKEAEGIVNPIETKQRPTKMGIAYRGFKEKTKQAEEADKIIHSRLEDSELDVESTDQSDGDEGSKTKKKSFQAKEKSRHRKPKVEYRSIEEVMNKVNSMVGGKEIAASVGSLDTVKREKIVDFTGKDVKEIETIGDRDKTVEDNARLVSVREQIQLGIELSNNRLQQLEHEKFIEVKRAKVLEGQKDGAMEMQVRQEATIRKIEAVLAQLDQCSVKSKELLSLDTDRLGDSEQLRPLISEIDRLKHLCGQTTEEADQFWKDWEFEEAVCALLQPCIQKVLGTHWNVATQPMFLYKEVFEPLVSFTSNNDGEYESYIDEINRESVSNYLGYVPDPLKIKLTPFEQLLHTTWLPPVRQFLTRSWDPHDPEYVLKIVEGWKSPVLPRVIRQILLEETILPRIRQAVEDWNPRLLKPSTIAVPNSEPLNPTSSSTTDAAFKSSNLGSNIPPHIWIHPWLLHIDQCHFSDLYTTLRHKLGVSLTNSNWIPGVPVDKIQSTAIGGKDSFDDFGLLLIKPWQHVFSAQDFHKLIKRSIIPKLEEMMRTQFVINAQNQDLTAFKALIPWLNTMPRSDSLKMLDKWFFEPWLQYLARWLNHIIIEYKKANDANEGQNSSVNTNSAKAVSSTTVMTGQIADWYIAWKSLFPKDISREPEIEAQLYRALAMMQATIASMK